MVVKNRQIQLFILERGQKAVSYEIIERMVYIGQRTAVLIQEWKLLSERRALIHAGIHRIGIIAVPCKMEHIPHLFGIFMGFGRLVEKVRYRLIFILACRSLDSCRVDIACNLLRRIRPERIVVWQGYLRYPDRDNRI